MNTNKTVPTGQDVLDFLATLNDEAQRRDSEALIDMMQSISGKLPVMGGASIIGFGSYHYKYASGREGDAPKIGFSPRKGKLSIYIADDTTKYTELLEKMGKYCTGKACIYITKLAAIDTNVLKRLIQEAYKNADHC